MRALNEGTQTQMRVLHEEVISRIAILGESAIPGERKTSRKRS
jgi:hypothetical protein